MCKEYPVQHDGRKIGTAFVTRQGLYYRIGCQCEENTESPPRIALQCGNRTVKLGLCVPIEGGFGIRTRIPVKRVGEEEMRFFVEQENWEKWISLESCDFLRYLPHVRLADVDGKPYFLLTDPAAALQGSDPSP